jgi:hypothetical protein
MLMFNNERDVEVPALLEFIARHKDGIGSLLDVGAYYSHAYYARQVRELVGVYDGIDIVYDPDTAAIADHYIVGNVNNFGVSQLYDCVVCLSTLEHCGISTYMVGDYLAERDRVFRKCIDLALHFAWFSFPVGKPYYLPGEFANIDVDTLVRWVQWAEARGWRVDAEFYYLNEDGQTYRQVESEVALAHEYDLSRIQQSFCILTLWRD